MRVYGGITTNADMCVENVMYGEKIYLESFYIKL